MKRYSKENFLVNGHISAEKKRYHCSVTTHSHDFFEFEYIVSGSGFYCIDGVEYPILDRTMYFMTPVNFHSVDMKDTVFYNVMFSADMCNIAILSKLFSASPIVFSTNEDTNCLICALLNELENNIDNIEYASMILETCIAKISLLSPVNNSKAVSSDIKAAELYILENFKKRLTLTDVAKAVMLSESHFSRKFARETGRNFKQYLNCVRYDYAKKLLVFSDMTVMQICYECGFDDYSNFVRRFKQNIGITPIEFRNNNLISE